MGAKETALLLAAKRYGNNPRQLSRDVEDVGDRVGDVVLDRGAREIYPREIKKKIVRTAEDIAQQFK